MDYNPDTRKLTLQDADTSLSIDTMTSNASINGGDMQSVKCIIQDGKTYLPLRFICEGLGMEVGFENGVTTIVKDGNEGGSTNPDYKPGGTPTYQWPDDQYGLNDETEHWPSWENVGSNLANTTVRQPGSSIQNDLEYLNSLVGNYGFGFAGDGQLTIGRKDTHLTTPTGNSSTYVAIGHSAGEYRSIGVRGWVSATNDDPTEGQVVQQNIIIESIKYFSDNITDAHAIIAYVEKYIAQQQYPPFDQDMIFGDTTVRFEKAYATWGFHIVFND